MNRSFSDSSGPWNSLPWYATYNVIQDNQMETNIIEDQDACACGCAIDITKSKRWPSLVSPASPMPFRTSLWVRDSQWLWLLEPFDEWARLIAETRGWWSLRTDLWTGIKWWISEDIEAKKKSHSDLEYISKRHTPTPLNNSIHKLNLERWHIFVFLDR